MKARSPVQSNSANLLRSMLDKGLTAGEAAKQVGISTDLFGQLIRRDKSISYRTASRLKAVFGSAAIRITDPAQV